jgi:amidase
MPSHSSSRVEPQRGRPPQFASDEFSAFDAVEQARLVRTGQVSPQELTEAALRRLQRLDPALNALAACDATAAHQRATAVSRNGLLAGVPTLIKDLMAYPGLPTAFGSRGLGAQVATSGCDYTEALDAGGLVVLGKSTTSELGLLGTTETLACGPTRNPWNTEHSTGGSSGGAVAAVASGMVPVAHASDGGGSIRGPASFNGLFGFKPSRGLTRSVGLAAQAPLAFMISDHCVSRSVRDSAAWLEATREPSAGPVVPLQPRNGGAPRRLRIGRYERTGFGRAPDPEVLEALHRTRALCEAAGHEVVEIAGPRFDAERASSAFFLLSGATVAGLFAMLRASMGGAFDPAAFEPYTQALAELPGARDPQAVAQALAVAQACAADADRVFEDVDVLLSPTTPFTAPRLGQVTSTSPLAEIMAFTNEVAGYTAVASMAGWCAMSVPLFRSAASGLPIGLHFAAPRRQDARLFELAYQLEAIAPWR